jgi:hypothetical protein
MTIYPSPDNPRIEAEIAVNKAFDSGEIFSAAPDKLEYYLQSLARENIPNPTVQHRAIIRALIINHLQLKDIILSLDRRNLRVTVALFVVAIASLIASVIQAGAAIASLYH